MKREISVTVNLDVGDIFSYGPILGEVVEIIEENRYKIHWSDGTDTYTTVEKLLEIAQYQFNRLEREVIKEWMKNDKKDKT